MAFHKINITVNGGLEEVVVPSNMTLMRMLRESLSLTGTKNGCSAGECGACTVLLNGEPAPEFTLVIRNEAETCAFIGTKGGAYNASGIPAGTWIVGVSVPANGQNGRSYDFSDEQEVTVEAGQVLQVDFDFPK